MAKSNKDQIIDLINTRYGGVFPYGVGSKIAAELGVSRQYVAQVLEGYPRSRPRRPDDVPARTCDIEDCDELAAGRSEWCSEHLNIILRCAAPGCGKYVVRSRATHRSRTARDKYSGKVFCDRACFGKYAGQKFGFGNTEED